jgi:hypothetical protein
MVLKTGANTAWPAAPHRHDNHKAGRDSSARKLTPSRCTRAGGGASRSSRHANIIASTTASEAATKAQRQWLAGNTKPPSRRLSMPPNTVAAT